MKGMGAVTNYKQGDHFCLTQSDAVGTVVREATPSDLDILNRQAEKYGGIYIGPTPWYLTKVFHHGERSAEELVVSYNEMSPASPEEFREFRSRS